MQHPSQQPGRPLEESVKMTRGELILSWIYMPFYLLLMPLLIEQVLTALGRELDIYQVNLIFFYVNFLVVAIGCRRFLAQSLQQTRPLRLIRAVLMGYGVHYLISLLVVALSSSIPGYTNPADVTTTEMILSRRGVMTVCAVLLGPLVEEVLVRGLIFAPLARRNRPLAYVVSTLFFSSMHLWAYVGTAPLGELLSMLDYVPGSIALAFAYERGRTIWCPIALHALVNAMGVWAVQIL